MSFKSALCFLFCLASKALLSQCFDINFSVPTSSCIDEKLTVSNTSSEGQNFSWDFCPGDFDVQPVNGGETAVTGASGVLDSKLIFDGSEWYNILVSRNNSKLFRVRYGNDLNNAPVIDEIVINDNSGGSFATLWGIDIIQNGDGNWVGIVTNANASKLNLLQFGSSLSNEVTVSAIAKPSGVSFTVPVDVDLMKQGGNYYAFVSNISNTSLARLDFGTTIDTTPAGDDIIIDSGSRLYAFSIIKYCDNFYGFGTSDNNDDVIRFDFGSSLDNAPSQTQITLNPNDGAVYNQPVGMNSYYHNGEFHLFVGSLSRKMFHVNLGTTVSSNNGELFEISNAGEFNFQYNVDLVRQGSSFVGYGLSSTNILKKIVFRQNCSASKDFGDALMEQLTFSESGTMAIQLSGEDASGQTELVLKTINVSPSVAPDIEFSQQNVCLTNPILFQPINSFGNITSYSWDFGDSNSSNDPNPMHSYTSAGDYLVALEVISSDGCKNSFSKSITVYNEPNPTFALPAGTSCTNQMVELQNTTAGNFGGSETWEWQVDGVTVSTEKDFSQEFLSPGQKEIKLIASIPGCSNEIMQMIDVIEGPSPSFTVEDACVGTLMQFTDTSTGSIDGYEWDFGNGFTADLQNPQFEFAEAGTYTVSLAVSNPDGCLAIASNLVTVYSNPNVQFNNDLACSQGNTRFNDFSTAANANITAWQWTFNDSSNPNNTSTEQDPIFKFSSSGDFITKLVATTNFGCKDSLEQTVSVLPSPKADFSFDRLCLQREIQFQDESVPVDGESLTSWGWNLGGTFSDDQNPTTSFDFPLQYTIELTVTSENLCTSTETRVLEVNPEPDLKIGVESACSNEKLHVFDLTNPNGDKINFWNWDFAGEGVASDSSSFFDFGSAGSYEVELSINTQNGCDYSLAQSIDIVDPPIANFLPSTTFGAPPLLVDFQNQSQGAEAYKWQFTESESSNVESPSFTFETLGEFEVGHIAFGPTNCSDTVTQVISVLDPILDLELVSALLVGEEGNQSLLLNLTNNGTLTVDSVDVFLNLGGGITLRDKIKRRILPNNNISQLLNLGVTQNQLSYICIEINGIKKGITDSTPNNNEVCITSGVFVSVPYPNPAKETIKMDVITAEENTLLLQLIDTGGKYVFNETLNLSAGSSEVVIPISHLLSGLYLLRTDKSDKTHRILIEN